MIRPHSPKNKFILTSGVTGFLILLMLFGIITPLFIYLRSSSANLQDIMIEQVTAQAKFHDRQELTKDFKEMQPLINELNKYFLGDDRDLSITLESLERLAKTHDLTLRTQLLASANNTAQFSLSVQGGFSSVMDFVRRLEQFPKFSKVESLNMAAKVVSGENDSLGHEVEASLLFTIYMLPEKTSIDKNNSSQQAPKKEILGED